MSAKNIAHQAVLAGKTALFTTAADLLLDLNGQETARALERRLRHYTRPTLLVCDEVGYLGYDARAADLIFQLVSRRYEHRAIDFDTMLTDIDRLNGVAGLVVKHVVPEEPAIQIPAAWMRAPVADTPNNWVQVRRDGDSYVAAVGQETFDVELSISLESGRILRATTVNPVETVVRDCADIELADCGEPRRRRIFRRVEMLAAD